MLEEQLADSANEMENTSKLLSLASGERDAAEAHATTAREELAMVEAAKDRAVGECENLRWELDAAQKKVASAEARLEAAKQKELQLEEEKAAAISEAVAANERADRASQNSSMEAKEALAAAHKEAEDAKSKWRAAIKKGKAIEKEKKELEGKLKSALRRCEEAEQRCSDAEVAASSSRDVLVAELASLREQLEDAHSEMAALKDGLHEALAGERAAQEQAATWEDAFNNIAGAAQSALQAAEAFERLAEPRRALDAGLIQAAYCAATEAKAAAEAAAAVPDYRAELDEAEEIKNKLRAAIKKGRAIEEEKNDLQVRLEQSMQRCAETERRCSDAEAAAASLQESSAEELAVLHLRLEEACAEAVALKEGLLEALAAKTAAQEQAATSQNTLTDVAGVAHSTLRAAKAIDGMVEFRRVLDAELASVAGCAVDSAIASSRQVEAAAAAAAVSDHSSELAEVKEVKNKLRAAIKKGKAIEKDKKYLEVQLQQALDRAAEAERRCAAAEAANPAPGLPGRDLIALQERLEEAQAESDALKAGLHEALVAETAAQEQTATLEESFADVHRAAQSALKAAGAADELVESRSILEAELSQIAHEAVVAATSGASHVPGLSAEIERLQQEILSLKAETKVHDRFVSSCPSQAPFPKSGAKQSGDVLHSVM